MLNRKPNIRPQLRSLINLLQCLIRITSQRIHRWRIHILLSHIVNAGEYDFFLVHYSGVAGGVSGGVVGAYGGLGSGAVGFGVNFWLASAASVLVGEKQAKRGD